ncbi:HAD-IIIA family hydrolase [Calidifontibacter sp. DB0510]|uniref:D,D-heptose 1,7-bisphosphate phosphatase n=1 Tax=Metallococcus carri TaxID=1656884 RepID=A0A967EG59_9MICO|nr:HAD-IIIA family hydrolase [Metallococcus carri]NHN54663.1 HAD-IIIA family hydrolase [Metallococcus carri]NOP37008.1 HAD-IIIA family hydrolase [Calidifontibacter sp. DB2511S]
MTDSAPAYSIVIPTVGRASLRDLLNALARQRRLEADRIVVVDDRGEPVPDVELPATVGGVPVTRLRSWGRGPAAARNLGWRVTDTEWVVFLDDDVLVTDGWSDQLASDLRAAPATLAGSQGRVTVPLPTDRKPTDWERNTAGLEGAWWITADLAVRRQALEEVAGFDERFRRAFREDADLALRLQQNGWQLDRGRRRVLHPVRPAGPWVSVSMQRGNADDALMRRLHGVGWRHAARETRGAFAWHVATVAAYALADLTAVVRGLGVPVRRAVPLTAATAGLLSTAAFAAKRIAPGSRTLREVAVMTATSAVIPPAAVFHRLRGEWRYRSTPPWPRAPRAVLFDRDGTLIRDVPLNTDPSLVEPTPGAREAVTRLRDKGIRVGVVSNQSAVGAGDITRAQMDAVNARVEELLGPFDTWQVCVHTPEEGCACRKPEPGMVRRAAAELGLPPSALTVVGDIGSDVTAALRAGARSVLVPTEHTLPVEIAAAPARADDLPAAVDLILHGGAP